MEPDFWLERWQSNQIGFHQDTINAYLQRSWSQLGVANDGRILVPLCGKSLDMLWLAEQGHPVTGIEISPLAVEQFFRENNLTPQVEETAIGRRYVSESLEILCADFFRLTATDIGPVAAFYDRAALIALPEPLRAPYVAQLTRLTSGCRGGLLVTLDYPQPQMAGPPFSVPGDEVDTLFSSDYRVEQLCSCDVLDDNDKFRDRGLSALTEQAWQLTPRDA